MAYAFVNALQLLGSDDYVKKMDRRIHVAIVVLGDLGRSPRMQYHAASLLNTFPLLNVTLIGYEGESLIPSLKSQINSEKFAEVRISIRNIFLEFLVSYDLLLL